MAFDINKLNNVAGMYNAANAKKKDSWDIDKKSAKDFSKGATESGNERVKEGLNKIKGWFGK